MIDSENLAPEKWRGELNVNYTLGGKLKSNK
jgi:hypothetical protein